MSDFNIKKASEFLRRKQEKKQEENRTRFEAAWRDFNKIVAMIIENYKPVRIYQWGYLLNENHFSEISDIDIAVQGIDLDEHYFAMIGQAMRLTDFPLDIVEIEKIEPIHAQHIREKGRLVYERTIDT
ncbi:MAG: hypothetical protein BWK80_19015 [Desulfobacteraceae bacterium IS3]|nr:MAG: hypothetical protein BWK80_19015 [Desulfobacteraceae bacterium IS3]